MTGHHAVNRVLCVLDFDSLCKCCCNTLAFLHPGKTTPLCALDVVRDCAAIVRPSAAALTCILWPKVCVVSVLATCLVCCLLVSACGKVS